MGPKMTWVLEHGEEKVVKLLVGKGCHDYPGGGPGESRLLPAAPGLKLIILSVE